jgi:AcrR family transcriptional regulator
MARGRADERRRHVLEAAIAEFAERGYHATSTTAIARRAGISQPYVYALFPNKRELFLAAHRDVAAHVRDRLVEAARTEPDDPEARLRAMGEAYLRLIHDRLAVLCQLQAYAAAGDPALRDEVRGEFLATFDAVRQAAGTDRRDTAFFLAGGAFLTIAAALGVPEDHWP